MQEFVPGSKLLRGHVDFNNFDVYVTTDEGEIKVEQLSQGMSSILGWIGPLLQRMYEIHADSQKPEGESAVVLVDEIDAHLHPEWQQRIVKTLQNIFPKAQFLVTTH